MLVLAVSRQQLIRLAVGRRRQVSGRLQGGQAPLAQGEQEQLAVFWALMSLPDPNWKSHQPLRFECRCCHLHRSVCFARFRQLRRCLQLLSFGMLWRWSLAAASQFVQGMRSMLAVAVFPLGRMAALLSAQLAAGWWVPELVRSCFGTKPNPIPERQQYQPEWQGRGSLMPTVVNAMMRSLQEMYNPAAL